MNTESTVTLDTLSEQLGSLTDLFRRRLLEDRTNQATIQDLQSRLDSAERAQATESFRPLATRISLVIERLQSTPSSDELSASVADELNDILALYGIHSFGLGVEIDSLRHEIVSVSGEGDVLMAQDLIRTGYQKDGVVLRPARITAVRTSTSPESDVPVDSAE